MSLVHDCDMVVYFMMCVLIRGASCVCDRRALCWSCLVLLLLMPHKPKSTR